MAQSEAPLKVSGERLCAELLNQCKSFGSMQTENSDVCGSNAWPWLVHALSCQALPFWLQARLKPPSTSDRLSFKLFYSTEVLPPIA